MPHLTCPPLLPHTHYTPHGYTRTAHTTSCCSCKPGISKTDVDVAAASVPNMGGICRAPAAAVAEDGSATHELARSAGERRMATSVPCPPATLHASRAMAGRHLAAVSLCHCHVTGGWQHVSGEQCALNRAAHTSRRWAKRAARAPAAQRSGKARLLWLAGAMAGEAGGMGKGSTRFAAT